MKVKILEQVNSHWSDGRHLSAGVGTVRQADDADADAVAHLQHLVGAGLAEVVEEPPAEPPEPTLAELKAEAEKKGLPTYGTKAQLQERIAEGGTE